MTGEIGTVGVSAALPVAGAEAVATRTGDARLPLPAGAHALPGPAAGIRAEISTAARLLSTLLNHPALADLAAAPAGPLLPAATSDAPAMAEALRTGIAFSGLFYESHQAEWVAGTRDVDDLRREPQARPAPDADQSDTSVPALVRQQLDMLDGQPLHWRGELWPGLPLQMSLQRDPRPDPDPDGRAASADETAEAGWQGQVISTLPSLGKIVARLRLTGDRLQIDLASAEPPSARLMSTGAATLKDALRAAGLTLDSFASRHDERA